MGDTREVTNEIILHLESDFSSDPFRALTKRAAALSAHLPARAFAPLSLSDTDKRRAACLEKMLGWFDLRVSSAYDDRPHIEIIDNDGIVQVGRSRMLFIAKPGRRSWAEELRSFEADPKPSGGWMQGNMDGSLVLADRIANVIRSVVGEEMGNMLRRSVGRPEMPHLRVSKMSALASVPERNLLYVKRLAAQGFAIRASQGVADRLSMPAQSDAGDASPWRWIADDVGYVQGDTPQCICTSASAEAAARALTASAAEAVFAVPIPPVRERNPCEVAVCGSGAGGVVRHIQEGDVDARRIDVGSISLPAARIFVGTDTSQEVADLALGALMAGIIPVIPPSVHSALWAVPSLTCKIAESGDADELAEIAIGLCGAQPRTLQSWHLRGTEVWSRIFGIRSR